MNAKQFTISESNAIKPFAETVWHEFSPLATKFGAVNLGQGFPNWDPPDFIIKAAQVALAEQTSVPNAGKLNQYARSAGHLRLVRAIAETYSPLLNRKLTPETDVCVSVGASEAIYLCVAAFVNPGDEVILLEPFFDIYIGAVSLCNGVARYVPLRLKTEKTGANAEQKSSDWVLDESELRAAFTPKTKLIILNTPHNPLGKVFSRDELEMIARVVKEHNNCVVVSDEVYEWLTYDGVKHERIATLPGMWERTVTVSSASKTFSVTGWKIGWTIGPKELIAPIMKVQSYVCFSVATPLQEAVAVALETAPKLDYFSSLRNMYQKKRDFLVKSLRECGLNPIIPQGSFFILVDVRQISLRGNEGREKAKTITGLNFHLKDWNVCRWLTTDIGVAAIPCSAFYSAEHLTTDVIRFCFCKTDETLQLAQQRLAKLKEAIKTDKK
jgi:aspartate/methionine/tyrosine aminotransferase